MQATDPAAVLVVLVAHDGLAWLPEVVTALEDQTHPGLGVVAVDNASRDGSREWLIERLGPDRVLLAERDLGFPAAVSMALDATALHDAPYVLVLHDDCVLEPEAVTELAAALDRDPRVAIVGAKLRDHGDRDTLQSVGWTIDVTGRADSGVDPGELDQGQRDRERRALYVSSAAMMFRREVFDGLGRFDRRFHVFRDDLDLCWRAWLAGHEVEVVPEAIGAHVAGATNYVRLGQTRFIGPRYFAERNTLATLLRNYGALRLVPVLVLYLLVGVAKVAGFLLTRRVSDAWQTVRAWLWNVYHLPDTLRLRRETQRNRVRRDRDLAPLFGRIAPRVRAYLEAIVEWVAGGDVRDHAPPATRREAPQDPEPVVRRLGRLALRRPVPVAGVLIVTLLLVGLGPLLLPGVLRGGELAPWPAAPTAFLADHVASWHAAGAFGTAVAPSPAQLLLGLLHLAVGGSSYLAPRLLLLAPLLAAWLLALRAVQPFSRRKLPRVVAATAYVLSPPALAALLTGRIGALVVLAVLPGIVAAANSLLRQQTPVARAWRAVAAAVLLTAIGGAFEPVLLVAVLAGTVVAIAVVLVLAVEPAWLVSLLARLGTVAVMPFVLLLPWSWQLLAADGPLRGAAGEVVVDPLWRWLVLSPELAGLPGTYAGVGFVLAGLLGLALGAPRAGRMVFGLWSAAAVGAFAAWALGRSGGITWPGLPLVLTAGSYAGLLAVAFATGAGQLGRHAFGWRQLASLATAAAVAVSLGAVAWSLLRAPWEAFQVASDPVPAFISAAPDRDTFRVLVLDEDAAGTVRWEVVPGGGPTMASYGVRDDAQQELVGPVVEALLSGRDPGAAERLGPLGIRYVVVPAGVATSPLDRILNSQLGLEQRPVTEGSVARVTTWLPRAVIVPTPDVPALRAGQQPVTPPTVVPLRPDGPGRYVGRAGEAGTVLVAERDDGSWRVHADGTPVPRSEATLVRAGEVPAGALVEVAHDNLARRQALAFQLLVLFLTVSLALRPPRLLQDRRPPAVRATAGQAAAREAAGDLAGAPEAAHAPADARVADAGDLDDGADVGVVDPEGPDGPTDTDPDGATDAAADVATESTAETDAPATDAADDPATDAADDPDTDAADPEPGTERAPRRRRP